MPNCKNKKRGVESTIVCRHIRPAMNYGFWLTPTLLYPPKLWVILLLNYSFHQPFTLQIGTTNLQNHVLIRFILADDSQALCLVSRFVILSFPPGRIGSIYTISVMRQLYGRRGIRNWSLLVNLHSCPWRHQTSIKCFCIADSSVKYVSHC